MTASDHPASQEAAARPRSYHAIPVSRRALVSALAEELEGEERQAFLALARLLGALVHHEFHERTEALKDAYAPLAPDSTRPGVEPDEAELTAAADRVGAALSEVLKHGNYRTLEHAHIEAALHTRAVFPIDVEVDFDVFDELVIYARGESKREIEVPKWLGLRRRKIVVDTYDRICLFLRLKPERLLTPKQRKGIGCEPGRTILKLFRDIPKADLEMLLPSLKLKMRRSDKLVLGVPAIVGGVPVLVKLAPVVVALAVALGIHDGKVSEASLLAGLGGLVALSIFVFRQWDKWKNRKVLFMKLLAENLYFRNVDNDEGVLTRLVDEAEEEECKETLLAYELLRRQPDQTEPELDTCAEAWIAQRFGLDVDFEIDDALAKLRRFDLLERAGERFASRSLAEALGALDERWNELRRVDAKVS